MKAANSFNSIETRAACGQPPEVPRTDHLMRLMSSSENLDWATPQDWFTYLTHYANYSMRNMGRMPTTLLLIEPDGPMMFIHAGIVVGGRRIQRRLRHECSPHVHRLRSDVRRHGAGSMGQVRQARGEVRRNPTASEVFDRWEFVILMGESHGEQKQKFLPIIRSGNGKFLSFNESEVPMMDEMKGRFAQLIPTKVPDAAMRDLANAMLKVKGVRFGRMGSAPRLPRSRR